MLEVVTAPVEWPITLDEAKRHLRVDHSDDDVLIEDLIQVAAAKVEPPGGECDHGLCEQTLRYWSSGWPCFGQGTRLIGVATEIVAVTYYDDGNVLRAADPADYFLTKNGRFVCFSDEFSPEPLYARPDAVGVEYKIGHSDPAKIPAALRMAVKFIVARLYADRGERLDTAFADDPLLARLLAPYRRIPA